jgi:hypothetical protein
LNGQFHNPLPHLIAKKEHTVSPYFKVSFPIKRNQSYLEKWLILISGIGQGKYKSGTSFARRERLKK